MQSEGSIVKEQNLPKKLDQLFEIANVNTFNKTHVP